MTSQKSTAPQFAETTAAYLERLESGQVRFAEALSTARERAARVTDKLVENLLASQRDVLNLGKTLAAQPTEYGKNVEAVLHSLTSAQERALELAKTAYRNNSEMVVEARAAAARALESSKTLGKPFAHLTSVCKPFAHLTSVWMPAAK